MTIHQSDSEEIQREAYRGLTVIRPMIQLIEDHDDKNCEFCNPEKAPRVRMSSLIRE